LGVDGSAGIGGGMTKARIEAEIRKSMDRISKERDKLRELIADATAVADCCDTAVGALEDAADTLSQYL
jgi:hypothetical protein